MATVAGRIVNGQLTTDVVEAIYLREVLSTWGLFGQVYDFEFHKARLKMSLLPDGTVSGVMAAYRPIENIFTVGRCCKGTASTANTDCASSKSLALMADGCGPGDGPVHDDLVGVEHRRVSRCSSHRAGRLSSRK